MSTGSGKQYGLILSKKQSSQVLAPKPSVFGNDSDSDNEESIGEAIKKESLKQQTKKQTQMEIKRALDEDPTVYEYDSIYDSIKEQKETVKQAETVVARKPKYIESLLKTAEKRKKDYERRVERKVQREREEEGDKFSDKESFVTSAYKKKMEEMQEEEEKEKRMDVIEAMMDVTKQKDLSGFYRHLLKRTTDASQDDPNPMDKEIKQERLSPDRNEDSSEKKMASPDLESHRASTSEDKAREALTQNRKQTDTQKLDADSDFSIDSGSSSSDSDDEDVASKPSSNKRPVSPSADTSSSNQPRESGSDKEVARPLSPSAKKNRKRQSKNGNEESPKAKRRDASLEVLPEREQGQQKDDDDERSSSSSDEEEEASASVNNKKKEPVLSTEEKLKLLFTKRTVGAVFEAARERYLVRKEAQRMARLAFAAVPAN